MMLSSEELVWRVDNFYRVYGRGCSQRELELLFPDVARTTLYNKVSRCFDKRRLMVVKAKVCGGEDTRVRNYIYPGYVNYLIELERLESRSSRLTVP